MHKRTDRGVSCERFILLSLEPLLGDIEGAFCDQMALGNAQRALRDERNYATLRIQYVLFNFVLK